MATWKLGTMARALACGAGLLALAGCASVDGFADRGVGYNAQIASAQDRMLFLNIVRAAYRRPMVFTSIAGVTGTATASGTLGFTLPFADNPNILPFQTAPQLSVSGGPTFTINNLDSQEFMKGILAPVSTATIDLFGQEGLPWQEIFDLMIAEATVTDDAHVTLRLYNRPGGGEADFQALLAALHEVGFRTEEVDGVETIGPVLSASDPHVLDSVDAGAKSGFRLARLDSGRYQLQRATVAYRFCVDRPDAAAVVFSTRDGTRHVVTVPRSLHCGHAGDGQGAAQAGAGKDEAPSSRRLIGPPPTRLPSGAITSGPGIEASFRSAEGVTYFLGEVVRQELCLQADEDCGEAPIMVGGGPGVPPRTLLRVVRGPARAGDLADVSYLGQSFRLPATGEDRSAQVLTVLGQLVNLNKSAKDNPAPSVVTLVGH